jgi:hypothetical protein
VEIRRESMKRDKRETREQRGGGGEEKRGKEREEVQQTKERREKGGVRGVIPAICLLISKSCTVTACISPLLPNTIFACKNKNKKE